MINSIELWNIVNQFQPHPLTHTCRGSWEFEVQVLSPQQMAVKMTGLLAYLKRVLWRFFFLLIVRGKNRTVKNSELSFIAYRFQPHPLACTKVQLSIRGVGSVFATKVHVWILHTDDANLYVTTVCLFVLSYCIASAPDPLGIIGVQNAELQLK